MHFMLNSSAVGCLHGIFAVPSSRDDDTAAAESSGNSEQTQGTLVSPASFNKALISCKCSMLDTLIPSLPLAAGPAWTIRLPSAGLQRWHSIYKRHVHLSRSLHS